MINKYRKEKIYHFTLGIIWLVGIFFFTYSDYILTGILTIIAIISSADDSRLLTNIQFKDGFYFFETYPIITQKKEIKISESKLLDIFHNNSIFKSDNLTIKYIGINGVISKRLYLNAEPWSELNSVLNRVKKKSPTRGYNLN